jgi:hypothetical protein
MKFDAAQITRLARDTGFLADNLEKVPRLRELLIELHKHPFLKGKLVLKGGTALNLFYLGLARLSVDIDLNYIGTSAVMLRSVNARTSSRRSSKLPQASATNCKTVRTTMPCVNGTSTMKITPANPIESKLKSISSCGLVRSRQG